MVRESYPWKRDLKRRKLVIQKHNTAEYFERDKDATYTVIEKAIFYSAFIIRKLVDCGGKLSDEADKYKIHVKSIKPLRRVDSLHRWPEEDSHDWDNEKSQTVAGKNICNWLIHSYLFFAEYQENGPMHSFFVSSDYDRNKMLYKVSIDDWMGYIDFIASDEIVSLVSRYDISIDDFSYTRKERGHTKINRSKLITSG